MRGGGPDLRTPDAKLVGATRLLLFCGNVAAGAFKEDVSGVTGPLAIVGRYAVYNEIAAGGMATVHFGRLLGPAGFSRTVAIKRLHPQLAKDPEFVSMFLDEARLAARVRHPNVVQTLDVVATQGELFLVMDYVQGETFSRLLRACRDAGTRAPVRVTASIVSGMLHGLHAAHEAKNECGEPLGIVHRDVSPQNVIVGVDGVSRVLDFGVAKAAGRVQTTHAGQLKGKLSYMPPEQIDGVVSRQTDVYAAAIVLWEALVSRKLFQGDNEGQVLQQVLAATVEPPSVHVPDLPPGVDEVVLKGLSRDPAQRWRNTREMAVALERAIGLASPTEVGEWVETVAHGTLHERATRVAEIESLSNTLTHVPDGVMVPIAPPAPRSGAELTSQPSSVSQPSQLSSVSLAQRTIPAPPPSGMDTGAHRGLIIGVVGAALALVLVTVLAIAHGRPGAPTAASSASVTSAPPTATVPTALPTTTAAPPPTTQSGPTDTASAAPSAKPTATARPTATAPALTATAAAPTSCNPPYTLDARGNKVWKRECIK